MKGKAIITMIRDAVMKSSRSLLSTLVMFLSVGVCAAMAQHPATAPAPGSQKPAHSRTAAFELHALTPEFWELFDKDATLTTMGTGFGFTEGPVWDPAGFLWVSDESKNRIDKLYEDGRVEKMVSLVDS